MKEIDIKNWERKEHFNFFLNSDLPFYNVNFNLNVTGLKSFSKTNGLSFNNVIVFLVTSAVNKVENLRLRLINGKVYLYDKINPSFACLRDNEELFRLITMEFEEDIFLFDQKAKEAIKNSKEYFDLSLLSKGANFVFLSPMPWIPFTGVDHTLSLKKEDAIPRISWGKSFSEYGKEMLPFNIQVNHIFADGIHVGRFYETLHETCNQIIQTLR